MKLFDGLTEEMKKVLSELEDLAAAINAAFGVVAKYVAECKDIALLKCKTFAPVFCISLPRSPLHVVPLWRTSRAYYRPSEKAGSARFQSFAKEGIL